MDRKQQAKETDIVSILSDYGFQPSRNGQTRIWYNSPFRSENIPSFIVKLKNNTWRDFGVQEGGDTISLVMKLESCTFRQAIDKIIDGDMEVRKHDPSKVPNKETGIDIVDVRDITDRYLIDYAKSRGIYIDVLRAQCKEVDFVYKSWDHVVHHAIGFKNDKGGYELRNSKVKVGNSPKYWTTVQGTDDDGTCDVFEGFFDFMSHLQINKRTRPKNDSFILNGLAFCSWVKPELDMYHTKCIFLDNGFAAKEAVQLHFNDDDSYIDASHLYEEYDDYNDYIKAELNK